MSMGRASPTTTVELATSREVPLGGNEYRKRSSMYTAPIQEALQMIRARISTAAIVDSLAQHVLCSIRRLFGAYGPPDGKYTKLAALPGSSSVTACAANDPSTRLTF
ncbi:hypothetical protein IWW34DRAFT_244422 [Fusarium oxysporum f. sp. albedinis]|nr:hypothetical protein IWW34DRAFT_244422 [Fusarium oxysporum f. sp. albedinis]